MVLKDFVTEMIGRAESEEFHLPHSQCKDNLCPECYQPVGPKQYTCPNCGDEFIKPSKPALMSLCLPCLGDFYMGHRFLGLMELFGYIVLWIVWIALLSEEGPSALPIIAIVLLVEHGVDALLTLHIAKKGLTSVKKGWRSHRS